MRRVFYLLRREIGFLFGTVFMIGIILSIFCAAFLSVVSVWLDVPAGLYDRVSARSTLAISVPQVSIGKAATYGGNWVYGTKAGLTTDVDLVFNGLIYAIPPIEGTQTPFVATNTTRGYAFCPDEASRFIERFTLTEGEWPAAPDEIAMSSDFARLVGGAKAGDTVFAGERALKVAAVFDSAKAQKLNKRDPGMPPIVSFYVCISEEEPLDFCYLDFDDARVMNRTIRLLELRNIPNEASPTFSSYIDSINLCEAFFGAIAAVLGFMVLFILYSLIAIFYRQRLPHICRLRLLGARSYLAAGIYCTVAIILGFFATAIGTGFSILFNRFFMGLCTNLFGWKFTSHFYTAIPFALFLGICIFDLILYGIYSLKIRNAYIAQEVKHE